jgi:hypothetical protein
VEAKAFRRDTKPLAEGFRLGASAVKPVPEGINVEAEAFRRDTRPVPEGVNVEAKAF